MDNKFYVYALLDPRKDDTPFYIGKGSGNRCYFHIKEVNHTQTSNPYKTNTIQAIITAGLEVGIAIIAELISEQDAYDLEMKLISQYGRKNNGTGTLTNMNNGGIGSIGRVPNPEHGQKISVALTGKFRPDVGARNKVNNSKMWEQRRAEGWAFDDDTIEKIRESATGRKHSQVSKDKIAAANKTRVVSDETKLKISAARKASVGTRTHSDETKQKMKEAWEKRRAAKTAPPSPT